MTTRTTRAVLTLVATMVAAMVTAVLVLPAAPAQAAAVANNDAFTVYAGADYVLSPLQNDRASGLFPGPISLCGLLNQSPQKVYVEQVDDTVRIEVEPRARGTVQFTYELCERSSRDTATVTLTVRPLNEVVGAKKPTPRGKVTFTNPNAVDVQVRFGSSTSGVADGTRRVGAGRTVIVGTPRSALYWVAYLMDGDVLVIAGDGIIRGVQRSPKKR